MGCGRRKSPRCRTLASYLPAHLRLTLLARGITDSPQFDALLIADGAIRRVSKRATREAGPRTSTPLHAHGGRSRTTTSGSFVADLRDRARSQTTSTQHTAAPAMTKTRVLPVRFRFQYCCDCWLYLQEKTPREQSRRVKGLRGRLIAHAGPRQTALGS